MRLVQEARRYVDFDIFGWLDSLRPVQEVTPRIFALTALIARFMGPIWDRQDSDGPHVGPMNFAIWAMVDEAERTEDFQCRIGSSLCQHRPVSISDNTCYRKISWIPKPSDW